VEAGNSGGNICDIGAFYTDKHYTKTQGIFSEGMRGYAVSPPFSNLQK
jgi:hypothetical protein